MFRDVVARLKAIDPACRRQGDVRFIVIGDGALREALEQQQHELGLEKDVIFVGSRRDPEYFYPALDVVALTSRNEGTPLTLIEAMANARPVVATSVGGGGLLKMGHIAFVAAASQCPPVTKTRFGSR